MRQSFFLSSSDKVSHRVAYTEWGEPGNPRVLICVHGLTRNGRDFDALAEALAGDYRVVCPDVVGRGASDWLEDKNEYGYPRYVADMLALIEHLEADDVHWVGTSMGGLIGMFLAAILLVLAGCGDLSVLGGGQDEGDDPGECSDGADNDSDGDFDCNGRIDFER